jgi:hypothetical protein
MTLEFMLLIMAAINMADALTTYIVVSAGGREVNPIIADIVNSNPSSIFLIHALVTAVTAVLFVAASALLKRLPAHAAGRIWSFFERAFVASLLVRSVIIINNVLGAVAGVTPIANIFVDT